MSKWLKVGTTFVVLIFLAYFLLIDSVIKTLIEREGSRALQAQLIIGGATFHLLPTSLQLRDVQWLDAKQPQRNLMQVQSIALPLSIGDLFAHKLIVDAMEVRGLRFNRPRGENSEATRTTSTAQTETVTQSAQLHAALQRAQQMFNHPLASNTLDPNASIAGALLADEFKPLLNQLMVLLQTTTNHNAPIDWQILIRHAVIDGALDFGNNSLDFTGTVENLTPQPQQFNVATQFSLHNAAGEPAKLTATGTLDQRKLAQATMRFDLIGFPLAQWPLSTDPELKIVIARAQTDVQALLSLTGNQLDLDVLARFQDAQFDISAGNSEIARTAADVWRGINAFDMHLQASGSVQNPQLKLNSSLDAPLLAALRQLQPPIPASPFANPQ